MNEIESWIARWQEHDERAAESLYNHYRDSTFRLAYGLLGDAGYAEEAAQDALTYALINICRYDPERASFSTWLHTITVSRCRDRQRRKRLPGFSLTDWLDWGKDIADAGPEPEAQTIAAEANSALLTALQALTPLLREAILLRYWAGHTYKEMAEIMHCPLPTAQSRVRLAYQQLKTSLAAKENSLVALEPSVHTEGI